VHLFGFSSSSIVVCDASTRTRRPGASSSPSDRAVPSSSAGIPPPPPRCPSTPALYHSLWPPRLRSKVRTPLPPLLSCAPSRSTGARTPARYASPPSCVGCQGRRSRHPFGLDRFASSSTSHRSKPHSKLCTGARDRATPGSLRKPLPCAATPPPHVHL
jgi:hypothetical protein